MAVRLKLRARDADDLAVVAACLQDAVLPLAEMAFQPARKRFVMVASRFKWEDAEGERVEGRIYERVHSGIRFDGVRGVRVRGLEQGSRTRILSLLTVESGEGHIDLVFSGGGMIRLETDRILCHVEDIDEPWPTQWRPSHPEADG